MPEWDVETVLAGPAHDWTAQDAELVKLRFHDRRPAVPRAVVLALWRYWSQVRPAEPLFDDADDNDALILHARAYGEPISAVPDGALARLVKQLEGPRAPAPLVPEPLRWGPMAALAPQVRGALPSSLIRAWLTTDGAGQPTEVLVIGEGLPEIRRRVWRAAMETSLRVNGLVDDGSAELVGDVVGVGIIRLSAGAASRHAAMDVPPVFGDRRITTFLGSSATAQGALRDFVVLLRKLARETGLVVVEEFTFDQVDAFDRSVRSMADRAAATPDTAFLRRPVPDDPDALVTLMPYLRSKTAGDFTAGTSVSVEFSPDLLETASYQRLEEAHLQAVARRLTVDAMLRRDLLVGEIEMFRTEQEAYANSSQEERRGLYDSTVLLVERFDERFGISIRLAEPEEIDSDVYYQTHLPQLIKLRESWVNRLTETINNLDAAVNRPYAPARQLAAGRFLDAVLRAAVPDESDSTTRAFERWRAEVQPMLWFEWRCALAAWGIDPADLFTRHTMLVSRYLPPLYDEQALLFTHPYTIVDTTRSALLANADRGVLVVRDATDGAQPVSPDELGGDPARNSADSAWAHLVDLAERRATSEREFAQAFLDTLRAHPGPTVRRVLEELQPGEPAADEAAAVESALEKADRATSVATGMDRARTAMRVEAFITARQSLEAAHGEDRWEVRAWLLRAIVECLAAEISSEEIPDALGGRLPGLPEGARRALEEADAIQPEYAREWLTTLPQLGLAKGIRRLFLGLPRARSTCGSPQQYAVLLFRRALEAIRVARELEEAATGLSDERETLEDVLVRIGRPLENVLVGPYADGFTGEALDLLEVLTGREPPKYGHLDLR